MDPVGSNGLGATSVQPEQGAASPPTPSPTSVRVHCDYFWETPHRFSAYVEVVDGFCEWGHGCVPRCPHSFADRTQAAIAFFWKYGGCGNPFERKAEG